MPQSLANVLLHITFSTKGRRTFLTKDVRPELASYMAAVMKTCESPALIIECVEDHAHILCSLSRTWAISEVVEKVKKRSSKWIKTKGSSFQGFQWQAGYGAFSSQPVEGCCGKGLHRNARATSPEDDVSRRVSQIAGEERHRI